VDWITPLSEYHGTGLFDATDREYTVRQIEYALTDLEYRAALDKQTILWETLNIGIDRDFEYSQKMSDKEPTITPTRTYIHVSATAID
jgi:hypothetical protein